MEMFLDTLIVIPQYLDGYLFEGFTDCFLHYSQAKRENYGTTVNPDRWRQGLENRRRVVGAGPDDNKIQTSAGSFSDPYYSIGGTAGSEAVCPVPGGPCCVQVCMRSVRPFLHRRPVSG